MVYKRVFAILVLIGCLFSINFSTLAQESDLFKLLKKEQGAGSEGGATSIGVSPVVRRMNFHPGALEKFDFRVSNQSTKYMLVKVSIGGALYSDGNIKSAMISDLPQDNLARWTKPLNNDVLLPPKSAKQFYFNTHVPKTAKGTNPMFLMFSGSVVKNPVEAKRDPSKVIAGVGYSAGVSALLYADIVGKTAYKLDWLKTDVIVKDNSVKAVINVKNVGTGNLKLQAWGTVLKSAEKKPLALLRRNVPQGIFPGQTLDIESDWSSKQLPDGNYKLMLVISEKDRKLDDIYKEVLFSIPAR
ncbi:MAG: hypothetical protein ABH859_03890 [Pseudomonadota bacterium]